MNKKTITISAITFQKTFRLSVSKLPTMLSSKLSNIEIKSIGRVSLRSSIAQDDLRALQNTNMNQKYGVGGILGLHSSGTFALHVANKYITQGSPTYFSMGQISDLEVIQKASLDFQVKNLTFLRFFRKFSM